MIMILTKYTAITIIASVVLAACNDQQSSSDTLRDARISDSELRQEKMTTDSSETTFYFGFDLRSSPQEDAKQYLPFLDYLSKATGYTFKLRFTPKDGKIVDDLGKGIVQFAAIGATSYIQASTQYGVTPLVRGLNQHGKAEYRSYLVVHKDSKINKFSDFYSKRMAFGNSSSTQGHLIPRMVMAKKEISLEDFETYAFTGSHQNCADAVIAGKADICGMQDTMAENLAKQGKLRIFMKSEYFPSSGIAGTKNLSTEVLTKVKQALLDFKPQGRDAKNLYHWDRTEMVNGFKSAKDVDYNELRAWMQKLKISVLDTLATLREVFV